MNSTAEPLFELPEAPAITRPSLLVFLRHAESERNVARQGQRFLPDEDARKLVQGVADHRTPLTARGRQQALDTGVALRGEHGLFDYAYHSGYQRTRDTLEHVLQAYSAEERARMQVRHHLFLRERDSGYTYDMTTAEAEAAFPWLREYWDTYGPIFSRPPGGESMADVAKRAYLFLNMLFRERAGQRVLVVTHGGTLRMFRMLLERWSWDEAAVRFHSDAVPQCSATRYEFDASSGRMMLRDLARVYWEAP
ncbi:MAG: histidine phosphatase family protein [Acidobacteria bacterium]|nr:histidine phosphatase family protein [Acidobacteriota bacterium]